MLNVYERRLILSYLSNVASRLHHRHRTARALAECVAERADQLTVADCAERRIEETLSAYSHGELSADRWQQLRDILKGQQMATRRVRADRTALHIRRLGRETQLSGTDIAILEILLRYQTKPVIESIVDQVFRKRVGRFTHILNAGCSALPELLDLTVGSFRARFASHAPLVSSGLVSIDDDGQIKTIDRLNRLVYKPGSADIDVRCLLFDMDSPGELEWSDFDHVREGRDHVESLIKGALEAGKRGVNILVYGSPGTGKTQFCRTLASRLKVKLYSVGEADDWGNEPNRFERLQELRLAQRLLAGGHDSILLFDEMEDLLQGPASGSMPFWGRFNRGPLRAGGSKVFMNRLLERNAVPTLWTTNSARQTCPTMLRRMMFALELRQPPPQVRARVWARQLGSHGIEASSEETNSLAREYDVSPGVAAGATAAARLVDGGDIATVRRGVRSLSRLLSGETHPQEDPSKFDPALMSADVDPIVLADHLAERGARRVSLCLKGPPGTGKSAYVRYLGERMGLEVVQKRASDLISMWVGGTEQQIAAAFAEARDAKQFLVFDEADSLLADRRLAQRSWEVSQVNEMLTWMESHPLPFACTTNFNERLDPATLRRFDFKIALDYLKPRQAMAAFRTFFGLTPPPGITSLSNLTPGDFAVVRRQAEVLGKLEDPEALAGMLRGECEAKPNRLTAVGFGRARSASDLLE